MLGDPFPEDREPRREARLRGWGVSRGVSLGEGVVVPDVVGALGRWWERDFKGVIWKFSWIGTERTRR